MADLSTTQAFNDGDQVTAAKMNNIIGNAAVLPTLITSKSNKAVVDGSTDYILVYDGTTSTLVKATPSAIRNATGAAAMPSSLSVVGNLSVNGNAGLGTASPSQKLDVYGGVAARGTLFLGDGSSSVIRKLTASTPLTIANSGGAAEMTIDSSGNVGINTNSPASALDVNGKISVGDGADSVIRKRTASTPLHFKSAGGTIEMTIDSSGSVGVGTASPTQLLTVGSPETPVISGAKVGVYNGGSSVIIIRDTTNDIETLIGTVTGTLNSVIGSATNHDLEFRTNNAERLRIDSSGNVGIGTGSSALGSKFNITGTSAATQSALMYASSSNPVQLGLENGYGARQGVVFANTGSSGYTSFGIISENTALTIKTAAYNIGNTSDLNTSWTERLRIDAGGNVGVGTGGAAATAKLDVVGTGKFSDHLKVKSTSTTPSIWSGLYGGAVSILGDNVTAARHIDLSIVDSAGNLATQGLRVVNSGNVGIGITNPQGKLGIGDASTSCTLSPDTANTRFLIGTDGASALAFGTNGATKMTISPAGDIGMGVYPAAALHLRGAELRVSSAVNNTSGKISLYEIGNPAWEISTTGANGKFFIKDTYNNATLSPVTRMSINNVGAVGIGTDTPLDTLYVAGGITCTSSITAGGNVTAYSDERLKKNWLNLEEGFVDKLSQVKSGTYDRIDVEGLRQIGVSAQSVRSLAPEAVIEGADGHLSVAYGNLAMSSCVELAKEIVALRQEIASLKSKIG